jgi:GT2 family glycosyltransferase
MDNLQRAKITAVTVTYGRRWHLLRQALSSAKSEGAANAIVISNGSLDATPEMLAAEFGQWASWVDLGHNQGSALGFAAGIAAAQEQGAERILLLDDDNILTPGSLVILETALDKTAQASDTCAVFGMREGHGKEQFLAEANGRGPRVTGSVFEFHVANLPGKLAKRLRKRSGQSDGGASPQDLFLPVAQPQGPYGGLLFSAELVAKIGIPDARYVLYQDDTEFTRRIVEAGGRLLLVPAAVIQDAEESWHNTGPKRSAMRGFVDAESDFRVFYTFRNKTHLDHHRSPRSAMTWVNSIVYLSLIAAYAFSKRRWSRLWMLGDAWQRGRKGVLGIHPDFPLQ